MDKLLTVAELAEYLSCSPTKVYRMAREDEIPFSRVGRSYRFDRDRVMEALSKPKPVGTWAQSNRSLGRKRTA